MAPLIMFGNAPWRDMFRLSLSVAEKTLLALVVYLFLAPPPRVFGKT